MKHNLITTISIASLLLVSCFGQVDAGTTERVSVASDGTEIDGGSSSPAISADGRYMVYDSSNLVPGDSGSWRDVFLRDRLSGTTERVSVASDGTEAIGGSVKPTISADGRYVAFQSAAGNLVPGDNNSSWDVFIRDRHTGTNERVSVASDESEGNSGSFDPSISADGRFVAFRSSANNLVSGDTNSTGSIGVDIFVRDRQTGTTERVSVASDGAEANSFSKSASISADGRYVAFISSATNLVPGDINIGFGEEKQSDVYVRDRQTGTTELVSVAFRTKGDGNGNSINVFISANGRYVVYDSTANNLVIGYKNLFDREVYLRDRKLGFTKRVSVSTFGSRGVATGSIGGGFSASGSISADGRFVVFASNNSGLLFVPGASDFVRDTNNASDVFLRDLRLSTTQRVSVASSGNESNGHSTQPVISADGRYIIFKSFGTTLVPGDTNGVEDVFVRNRYDSLNHLVAFPPDSSTYSFTLNTSGCPSGFVGKFGFDALLTNTSLSALSELNVQVAELTNGNLLLVSSETIGVGSAFPVPTNDGYSDHWLDPNEDVEVTFTVCLKNTQPFKFLVDVLGVTVD